MANIWTSEDIKKKVDTLKELQKKATNEEDSLKYDTIIASLESFLIREKLLERKKFKGNDAKLFYVNEHHNVFQNEFGELSLFFSEISSFLNEFNLNDTFIPRLKPYQIKDSEEQLLELISAFYKTFDRENYKYFEKNYKNRDTHFCYKQNRDTAYGECVYIPKLDENFIWISPENFFTSLAYGVHEYGHAIANNIRKFSIMPTTYDFLTEVEAYFPQLVALDFFRDKLKEHKNEIAKAYFVDFISKIDMAQMEVISKLIVNEWLKNNLKAKKAICEVIKNYNVKRKQALSSLNVTDENYQYVISFLTSIELYYMYQEDRDKALWLYDKIRKQCYDKYYQDLLDDEIKLSDHVQDYTLSLMLKAKLIKQDKINEILVSNSI